MLSSRVKIWSFRGYFTGIYIINKIPQSDIVWCYSGLKWMQVLSATDKDTRQECRNVGSWIVPFQVVFILSHSIIKLCLIVHLTAAWTVIFNIPQYSVQCTHPKWHLQIFSTPDFHSFIVGARIEKVLAFNSKQTSCHGRSSAIKHTLLRNV